VNQSQFRRHDLVWLDPQIDAGKFASELQAEFVRSWVKQDFPFIVARQSDEQARESNQIILGFTLPSAPSRTRVMLKANRHSIIRHSRPILLSETINFAPESWRIGLNNLVALFEKYAIDARVYGSLSSEILTGMRYLDESSDLDLLLEINDETNLPEFLENLEKFPLSSPHIDGELLFPSGWSVSWRELATALLTGIPRSVLAKSSREIRLIPADEFTHSILIAA